VVEMSEEPKSAVEQMADLTEWLSERIRQAEWRGMRRGIVITAAIWCALEIAYFMGRLGL